MSSSKGPDDRQIVEILEQLCARLKLTQAQLAEKLQVSLPTMNRWMNGRSFPRGKQRREFLAVLDQLKEAQPEVFEQVQERQAGLTLKRSGPGRGMLSTKSMEQMLWDAACSIRGEKDAPKFKDYILPLIFIKRLSDVFEDEVRRLVETYGDEETALSILEADHTLVRFYLPPETRWPVVSGRQAFDWPAKLKPKTLGEQLTTTVRLIVKSNPDRKLEGVIDIVDFNETRNGEREISDQALSGVIETLSDPRYRLGLQDVEPDFLGRAYEYLLRKFAEGQGQSAGEFFTPQEVGWLMAYVVRPRQGEEVYDYACGSAGLLIKCELALIQRELKVTRPLRLYGQELTGSSYAIARMNMVIHDMEGEIVRGNSMTNPKFRESDTSLKKFDIVVANPMWNQPFDEKVFENDPFGRFEEAGGLTTGKGDWAWLQHTIASLKPTGRAAVVLDTGAASRGSGKKNEDKERNIRKWFVERDLVEGVILLPDNLFYNTTAPGVIIVLNRNKPKARVGKIVLVNASEEFKKGQPKNYLTQEGIKKIADAFISGVDVEKLVKVITNDEAIEHDLNLSPSRFVAGSEDETPREFPEILREMDALEKKQTELRGQVIKLKNAIPALHELFASGLQREAQKETQIGIIPESWDVVPLDSVLITSQYGLSVRGQPSGKYPMLRMNCQVNGRVHFENLQFVDLNDDLFRSFELKDGDILFNRTNSIELVGRTAIFHSDRPAVFASYLIRLRLDETQVIPDFINYYFNMDSTQAALKFLAQRGVSQANISASKLRGFYVPKPPIREQQEIVKLLNVVNSNIAVYDATQRVWQDFFRTMLHQFMTAQIRVNDLAIDTR